MGKGNVEGCGANCAKYLLFFFNLIFFKSTSTAGEKGGPRGDSRSFGNHVNIDGNLDTSHRGHSINDRNRGSSIHRGRYSGNRYNPYDKMQNSPQYHENTSVGARSEYERYFEKRPLNDMERRLLNVLQRRRDDYDQLLQQQQQSTTLWDPYNRPPPEAYKRVNES